MISESFVDAPAGTSHFDAPLGLSIRAKCAPILDLDPFPDPDAYIERRAALGAAEVNRRFVKAANCGLLLIDTGFRSDRHPDTTANGRGRRRAAREVVRIEAIAERVGRSGVGAAGFSRAFADELAACQQGRRRPQDRSSPIAAASTSTRGRHRPRMTRRGGGKWLPEIQAGRARMEEPTLLRHGLWVGAELAQAAEDADPVPCRLRRPRRDHPQEQSVAADAVLAGAERHGRQRDPAPLLPFPPHRRLSWPRCSPTSISTWA